MYISNVHIENFRNFSTVDVPLKPFTIIVGKNDTGKSNLVDAINILLYNSKGNYYAKSLTKYDFNFQCINEFVSKMKAIYEGMKDDFNAEKYAAELVKNAPIVIIRMKFEDAKTPYEQSLLRDWLNGDEKLQFFEIEYKYYLKDNKKLNKLICDLEKEELLEDHHADFQLLLECYDHYLRSTNNNKSIDYTKIKNFVANTIDAERDSFSSGDTASATRVVANIINSGLNLKDKAELTKRYEKFFNGIKLLDSFRSIYSDIISQNQSIEDFINDIQLVPNAKKYKDIIENITLSYGNDMLFQRGLGTRNLIFLLTLYSYFLSDTFKRFNLVCIEEPESHLDINNLKIAIEFFQKAQGKNALTQLVISTHSNQIMNKLELTNVILLLDNTSVIDLANIDPELVYYLAKRENFDTLNMFYASKLIMVEGATEEIYINSLLQRDSSLNNIRVISIGQKGFKSFIKAWTSFHEHATQDKLGIVRDYDYQDQAKREHEAYNSNVINIETSAGKEFEQDFVEKDSNLAKLNKLFDKNFSAQEMYDHMTSDKLNNIIAICRAMDEGVDFSIPGYIGSLLEWIKR
ncbi:MAG: AAA family ATPase [Parabacteroides sp.]|nr:AAA family ATPase [Parabacteroides sp.]